jgi:hypothetical protein
VNEQNLQNLFHDGMLVDLTVRYWSAQRKLNEEDIGLDEVSDAFSLGKKLLIPYEIMHEFKLIESRARTLIDNSSYRFPIGNARFIPKRKFIKVVNELKELQTKYKELVNDLITNYQQYREHMRPIYLKAAQNAFETKNSKVNSFGIDYDPEKAKASFVELFMARIEACYPLVGSLEAKFGIDLAVFEVALPKLQEGEAEDIAQDLELKQELANEYRRQMQSKITSFVDDAVSVLRQEAIQLCKHVSNNITEGKIIKSTTISSLTSFIEKFQDMNFVGDKTIEASLNSLRKEILDVNPASEFSSNEELKAELGRRLNLIVEQATNTTDISSITGQYKRKINWEN